MLNIFSLFENPQPEPQQEPKTQLEIVLENAKALSVKLDASVTDILLAQLLINRGINHENRKPNL